jgi:hypothetical protein
MNATELVEELKKVGELFEWKFIAHPQRLESTDRRSRPRLRVRGRCKQGPADLLFEPIGAVCFVRTGVAYDEDHWLESAVTLEISPQDAKDLVAAANDLAWRQVDERREPNPHRQMLRQSMVTATGLDAQLKDAI